MSYLLIEENTPLCFLDIFIKSVHFKTLYILGAGVSRAYISTDYKKNYESCKQLIYTLDSFPVSPSNELSNKNKIQFELSGSPHKIYSSHGKHFIDQTSFELEDSILHTIPELLEIQMIFAYSLEQHPIYCPEYQIFNYANRSSIIANLNHDYLAKKFIYSDSVIDCHGSIKPEFRSIIKKYFPRHLEYNKNLVRDINKDLYLANKEDEKILLQSSEYNKFIHELSNNSFTNVMVIGYSFFKQDSSNFYDVFTYDLIRDYINSHHCNLIIVDPDPEYVADIFSNTTRIKKCFRYKIFWDSFCSAFFKCVGFNNKIPLVNTNKFQFFNYFYKEHANINHA